MKNHMQRLSTLRRVAALTGFMFVVASTSVSATTLSDIFQVAEQINQSALRSQSKIDALTEETRKLLNEYKTVLKEIEGLRVYNRQLEKQISNQESEMAQLAKSIDEVTVIERQIAPLMLRMIDGLEQFVDLDMPFLLDERHDRIERLREMMDRADVAVSEKFSQVFRAYQIENEYGRTMETYGDTISIGGTERKVDILKVGRVALVYQTPDGEETGMYNLNTNAFEPIGNEYQASIRQGIRMARQQATQDMFSIPVHGAEAAQ
jgi:predicted RNase H-like nuclease (RuvC/YqgF family)